MIWDVCLELRGQKKNVTAGGYVVLWVQEINMENVGCVSHCG